MQALKMKPLKRERWETVFDRADIGERENNISYNESNIQEVYHMLKFIALLIGLVIGLIAIVVVGGIGIGVTILAFGDVIVGVILLVLMIKKSKKKSRS